MGSAYDNVKCFLQYTLCIKKILYTWIFFWLLSACPLRIQSLTIRSVKFSPLLFWVIPLRKCLPHSKNNSSDVAFCRIVNIIQTLGRPSGNFNTAHGGGNGYTVRISFMCAVQIYRLSKSATKRWLKKAFSQQCRRSFRLLFSSWWFWYG